MANQAETGSSLGRGLALLGLVSAPFFVNDFVFLQIETDLGWLAADYASKAVALALLFGLAGARRSVAGTMAAPRAIPEAAVLTLLAAAAVVGADWALRNAVDLEVEALKLFQYPQLDSSVLYWTDLSFGLALTAVSEELVFRGLFARLLGRALPGAASMAVASAAFFALIHWSHGLTALAVAFVAGLVLMGLYRRTGSLLPPMAAHYLVNLWDFV